MKRIVLFVLSLFLLSFFVPVLPPVCQAAVLDGAWQYRLRPDTGEWTNYIENTPVPVQGDVHEGDTITIDVDGNGQLEARVRS